jgi:hypothetical protein
VPQNDPPGRFDYLWEDLSEPDEDIGYYGHGLDSLADEPVRWYRTTSAMLAMAAIAVAVIAILVSAVLLMSRQSGRPGDTTQPSVTPTTATTTATAPSTSASAPPPASPAPSPSGTASVLIAPPAPPRRPTPAKPPQINVTRKPLSVQPSPQPGFPHN